MSTKRKASTPSDALIVADLGPAHGIRGEITARIVGVDPEWLRERPGVVLRSVDGREVPAMVQRIRPKKDFWILALDVLRDRNDAQAHRGSVLVVARELLPELAEDEEWYVADLVGLAVQTVTGEALGVLEEVLTLPANDVFVVRGERGEILLPVIDDVIRDVDLREKRIVVELLPGLVEDDGEAS